MPDFAGHLCNIWDVLAVKNFSLFSEIQTCILPATLPGLQGRGRRALWQVLTSLRSPLWAVAAGFSSVLSLSHQHPRDLALRLPFPPENQEEDGEADMLGALSSLGTRSEWLGPGSPSISPLSPSSPLPSLRAPGATSESSGLPVDER